MLFSSEIFLFVFLPFVLIVYYGLLFWSRTAQNLFIVYGRMPQLKGSFVGLKSDNNGQVKQIWELTEKEALDYVRRPDARFPQ